MGDQMICLIIYICVGAIMTALIHRLWGYRAKSHEVPELVWAILASIFWPASGPAILVYNLSLKLVDKFTKV